MEFADSGQIFQSLKKTLLITGSQERRQFDFNIHFFDLSSCAFSVNAQTSIFGRRGEFKTLNSWGAKKIPECVCNTTHLHCRKWLRRLFDGRTRS
jgi:hypothetical protein